MLSTDPKMAIKSLARENFEHFLSILTKISTCDSPICPLDQGRSQRGGGAAVLSWPSPNKSRGSIVTNNWHLTNKTSNWSVIPQRFRYRASTFWLNFHTANCLLNSIKIWKFHVYNFNFHIFQQICTLSAYWLQRICWCSLLLKSPLGLGPPISQKNLGAPPNPLPPPPP